MTNLQDYPFSSFHQAIKTQGRELLVNQFKNYSDYKCRKRRKIEQLVIDEITFVLSGIGALIGFQVMAINPNCWLQILCGFELVLLLILGAEIVMYADLKEA